jgi:hypothetical protein
MNVPPIATDRGDSTRPTITARPWLDSSRWKAAAVLLVLAIGLVTLTPPVIRNLRRSSGHWRAATLLTSLGGRIERNGKSNLPWRGGSTSVFLSKAGGTLTDKDLALLRDLIEVDALDLTNCGHVTDQGLSVLAELPDLGELHLGHGESPGPRLTGETLLILPRLTKLKYLSLAGVPITDQDLLRLRGLKNLEILDLDRTSITDAGLDMLPSFPRLQSVMLSGTEVSKEALWKLKQRMPTLVVAQDMFSEDSLVPGAPSNGR